MIVRLRLLRNSGVVSVSTVYKTLVTMPRESFKAGTVIIIDGRTFYVEINGLMDH